MATLKEIQNCQLQILKDVADFCDRHSINYYLAAGTLLGAVRHQGFIPWDDDVDVFMDYNDLSRFKSLFIKEMSKNYFYQDNETDPGYISMFPKIMKNGTYMPEKEQSKIHQGVWIDIFPLVSVAENEEKTRKQIECICDYQNSLANYGSIINASCTSLKNTILKLYNCIKYKRRIKKQQKEFVSYQCENADKFIILDNLFWKGFDEEVCSIVFSQMLPKKWFKTKKYYVFEDYEFSSLWNSNEYLIMLYGKDYMIPVKYAHLSDYSKVIV